MKTDTLLLGNGAIINGKLKEDQSGYKTSKIVLRGAMTQNQGVL